MKSPRSGRDGKPEIDLGRVLGHAGIPTVIFGPGGEGLHGIEEYVRASEVLACRDALVKLIGTFA